MSQTLEIPVRDLLPNDLLDYDGPLDWLTGNGYEVREADRIAAEYELARVDCIEVESPELTVIHTDMGSYAVPPDLVVDVLRDLYESDGV